MSITFASSIHTFLPALSADRIPPPQMTPKAFGAKALPAQRWADLPERGTPTSLRLIDWIAVHIGRWAARLLLYPITLYFLISGNSAWRVSHEYLKRVRG